MNRISDFLLLLGLIVGIFVLIASLATSISYHTGQGQTLSYTLGRYFSFLTIQTNIWLLFTYLAERMPTERLSILRHPAAQSGALATILLVGIYHHLVLAPTRDPLAGISWFNDLFHHTAAPIIYLLWWLATAPRPGLRFVQIPLMLTPLVAYACYILVRGAIFTQYPYPALNAAEKGYPAVFSFIGIITIVMVLLSALIVTTNALIARISSKPRP